MNAQTETGTRDFSKVLRQVQLLIQMAEAENYSENEAERAATEQEQERARAKADALMLEYAIHEMDLDNARPVGERMKPGTVDLALTDDQDMLGPLGTLASWIASHCRCRIRMYFRYDNEMHCWSSRLYGYEGDLRYAEFLYTTIRLHMLGILRPKVDPMLSIEENCYRFHNAGFNWLEIAAFYGWRKDRRWPEDVHEMWFNINTSERRSNWQVGSYHKRAYQRACKARGEGYTRIAAGGTETYRRSATQGYTAQINRRLRQMRAGRDETATTALALRTDDIDELFKSQNGDLFVKVEVVDTPPCPDCEKAKSGHCRKHPKGRRMSYAPHNEAAYAAGARHADRADLGTGGVTSNVRRIEA
jgi:hypothetical protein